MVCTVHYMVSSLQKNTPINDNWSCPKSNDGKSFLMNLAGSELNSLEVQQCYTWQCSDVVMFKLNSCQCNGGCVFTFVAVELASILS